MTEIIKDLTAMKSRNEITSKHLLSWIINAMTQRNQKTLIETIQDDK